MVASKLATLRHGGDRKSEEIKVSNDTSIDDAAKQLNVGRATVARAKQVQEWRAKMLRFDGRFKAMMLREIEQSECSTLFDVAQVISNDQKQLKTVNACAEFGIPGDVTLTALVELTEDE